MLFRSMISTRNICLGAAALFAAWLAVPVFADGASDFQAGVTKAQGTLSEIKQLGARLGSRSTASTDTATTNVAHASETYKCPACGMAMTSAKTASNSKSVKIKGKTWYCCAGCNMSAVADKQNTSTPVKRTPRKKSP